MNHVKAMDGSTAFNRVSKAAARKAFNAGREVVFCPCKLAPFGPFRPSVMFQKGQRGRDDFDGTVKDFQHYNCNMNETGYYASFYTIEF